MTSQAAIHRRNLESSILFMQQEHANTLKALHEEIEKLQKKCSDLTFQLTMHGLSLDDEGSSDIKLKEIQEELQQKRKREKELTEELREKTQLIKSLENELKVLRRRYLEEQRSQNQLMNNLKAELEAKSNNVAYLTTELHRIKIRQKMEPDEGSSGVMRKPSTDFLPNPPRDPSTYSRRNLNVRRAVPIASSLDEMSARPLRISSSKSNSTLSSRSGSPDISPFVQREVVQPQITSKPAPPVLPPIPVSSSKDGKSLLVHQILPSHPLIRRKPGSPQGLTALAMESVPRVDKPWPHAQESHSSEYN